MGSNELNTETDGVLKCGNVTAVLDHTIKEFLLSLDNVWFNGVNASHLNSTCA